MLIVDTSRWCKLYTLRLIKYFNLLYSYSTILHNCMFYLFENVHFVYFVDFPACRGGLSSSYQHTFRSFRWGNEKPVKVFQCKFVTISLQVYICTHSWKRCDVLCVSQKEDLDNGVHDKKFCFEESCYIKIKMAQHLPIICQNMGSFHVIVL